MNVIKLKDRWSADLAAAVARAGLAVVGDSTVKLRQGEASSGVAGLALDRPGKVS